MRPHQLEACEFLFAALESPHLSSSGASAVTGAILADEMGLGKSLTSIAVMWAYVRRDKCKCVVICPASLVNNWNKELRKWLAVKVTPICVKSGAGAGDAVRSFSVGHVSMSPILIVSYEMYRTHCEAINQTKGLDVLVCDEGHRLKNAQGTRTLDAFASSTATKRLLLSGTPIQNNLGE
jgi:DNA repair and recombination RAD54-like protein